MKEKKTDLRILKTKKNLYTALLDLMKDKTFEEIKVSDICSSALVNRSTFYTHFDDKYTLFDSLIKDLKKGLQEELSKNKNISSSREYYMEMIKLLLDHIEERKEIYSLIMIHNKNSISLDMIYDALNEDITKRLQKESTSFNKEIPIEFVSKFYLGAVFNVGMEYLKNSSKYTRKELIQYLEILLPDQLDE